MRRLQLGIYFAAIFFLVPQFSQGQDKPMIAVVMKRHLSYSPDFKFSDWQTAQKEYFDKVTAKNELVVASNLLVHYYTPDASEVLFYSLYNSWEDVEKAADRDNELIKAAWPDSIKRRAATQKLSDFFTSQHSDEIMRTIPQLHGKQQQDTSAHIYYVRTSHLSFPKDGTNAEILGGLNEYTDKVMAKNDMLKGYYPFTHFYGADSREFTEVFVYNSLTDLEKATKVNTDLMNKSWPDAKKREEMGNKITRYFEPWHADAIYQSLPGFQK